MKIFLKIPLIQEVVQISVIFGKNIVILLFYEIENVIQYLIILIAKVFKFGSLIRFFSRGYSGTKCSSSTRLNNLIKLSNTL